ncbi:uncharacterized protein N7469_002766 [Penicillium citrinum]|uniref:Uncharacterized protein n=2 Tax=Penicillium TaxID=5073 RepID=A0A9W9PB34_PENCI|nr:uncharacterized protein N7469_002766 [Penicillium citrinum]KAJ5241175.1 hypothetical protein N7469_002766 [Penicillium citrinum]KAJ5586174.1 hypothetical protein N7450_005961 [Penicillium hetheringtonii]
MRYWRNDYPRIILKEVDFLRENFPNVPPAHVYIVLYRNFQDKEKPITEISQVFYTLDDANDLVMTIFKEHFLLWFMQSSEFENWVRGPGLPQVNPSYKHVVNWNLHPRDGTLLLQAREEMMPGVMDLLGSVEVLYHVIQGL